MMPADKPSPDSGVSRPPVSSPAPAPRRSGLRFGLYLKVVVACAVLMLAVYALVPYFLLRAEYADLVAHIQSAHQIPIDEAVSKLALRGRVAVLVAMLVNGFLMLVALLVLRTAVRPVERVSLGLRKLAAGQSAEPILDATTDELADLTKSYNALAEQLDSYRQEVARQREELEQNVKDRTRELEVRTQELEQRTRELEASTSELLTQKQFIESVVETADFGLVSVDSALRVTVWNRCLERLLGVSRASVLGKPFSQVVPITDNDILAAELEKVAKTGQPASHREFQTQMTAQPDGARKFLCVDLAINALRGAAGELRGAVLTLYDETERRNLHAQLSQSTKLAAVGELAGGVAHEINNPLAIILGNAELLIDDLGDGSPLTKQAQTIKRHALRCKDIVANLLKFAGRTQHGSGQLDLERLLFETLALLRKQLELDNIKVEEKYEGNVGLIVGSSDELQQVFFNLFSNARDAMPKGGTLSLETRREGNWLVIRVHDTGTGITPENLERVFSPFFTTKDPGKGTGLGLAIAHTIAMKHGGDIRLESELGKGTAAIVRLPLGEPEKVPAERVLIPAPLKPVEPELRKLRVMLIDDEAGIRMICREALERIHHEVVECEDGFEALDKLGQGSCDLILLDLKMPRLNGAETLVRLRERGIRTPVLIMTGLIDEEMLATVPAGAFSGILKKPFQISELKSWVAKIQALAPN